MVTFTACLPSGKTLRIVPVALSVAERPLVLTAVRGGGSVCPVGCCVQLVTPVSERGWLLGACWLLVVVFWLSRLLGLGEDGWGSRSGGGDDFGAGFVWIVFGLFWCEVGTCLG